MFEPVCAHKCRQPRLDRVTFATIIRKHTYMLGWILMTACTFHGNIFKLPLSMTRFTRCRSMCTIQRKGAKLMIEAGHPIRTIMAGNTLLWIITPVFLDKKFIMVPVAVYTA